MISIDKRLKPWLKIVSDNQKLYNSIYPILRKLVLKNEPETTIILEADKQLKSGLFRLKCIITIDIDDMLIDADTNAWKVNHEVISIDFLEFGIFNEHKVQVLNDMQLRLLRNAVDSYLRVNYTLN